ncbi:PilZ domain-containing protein [Pseudooceanicola sp. CBS1P-1]|uniref:PilZ domain-containing protein n=1 Tax=Pseudooceanicola albus TaxID=2692189 RepID=A0A6L7FZ76_9RHOB|nr:MULTISPECIES: PilZ domain-containing protein [Pseudooceanicola]MBT9382514.1 PilZ domain-containing protein [Pseudooceanicola endophyticus]MXN17055.1 hypothetical protein [Pseudooceanicola albus]
MHVVLPQPPSLANRRRHARYALSRPCELILEDKVLTARLLDISAGGARLLLPLAASGYGPLPQLRFRLPQICTFRADLRWSAHHHVGLQFDELSARQSGALRSLLSELERRDQASREITTVTSGFLPISP